MDINYGDLDMSLASTAWRLFWLESHNQENFDELIFTSVWQPVKKLLNRQTSNFTCFAGKHYMFPRESPGIVVNIFFISPAKELAYLGTLFDPLSYALDKLDQLEKLAFTNPEEALKIAKSPRTTIIRDLSFCKIPADSDRLDTATATRALQQYFAIHVPKLTTHKNIQWLSHKEGVILESRIKSQAEIDFTAKKPLKN